VASEYEQLQLQLALLWFGKLPATFGGLALMRQRLSFLAGVGVQ
jgi:hypothetical protein